MDNIKNIAEWEVLTPGGWSEFSGIKKINAPQYIKFTFNDNTTLKCSRNHKIKLASAKFIYAANAYIGNKLIADDSSYKTITKIDYINENIELFDLLNVASESEYYTNGIVSHNCAFIENANDIWTSAQQTLAASGGKAILLSTPNGVGGMFHQTWIDAEAGTNNFNTINLKWNLHPDRDQSWRDKQTAELGEKKAAQECDCSYISSGNNVVDAEILEFYEKTFVCDPVEKRGIDKGLWIWEYPDYTNKYIISADVARGDGSDKSAYHVIDIKNLTQVAEYKGLVPTKAFGRDLVATATYYNNAILIVENNNMGWAVLQEIIDLKYPNTFYSSADLTYVDVEQQMVGKINSMEKRMLPGFSTTTKTRPLIISKLESYFRDKELKIKSKRTIDELYVFIWNGNKAEAMRGYNDDLVMSLGTGLWVRDTALRLFGESGEMNKSMLNSIKKISPDESLPIFSTMHNSKVKDAWSFRDAHGNRENLGWLL